MTNRRGFLGALAVAVAGPMVIDPEKLLWRPGAKLISIPKPTRIRLPLTAFEIIQDAHRILGTIPVGEVLSITDVEYAYRRLNRMLENWNTLPPRLVSLELARDLVPSYAVSRGTGWFTQIGGTFR